MIILDYDINDGSLWEDSDNSRENLISHIEILIKRILLLKQKTAILYFNVATSIRSNYEISPYCSEYKTMWQLGDVKLPIMKYYDIQIISQKMAIWRNWTCPPHRNFMDVKLLLL